MGKEQVLEATAKISKVAIDCSAVVTGDAKPVSASAEKIASPEWDKERCIRCGICYLFCSTGAVTRLEDGYFEADTQLCSGCGICHRECWCGVIGMVEEE
jgi:pyruvate ferredoxin oxidoreductase delta subunit